MIRFSPAPLSVAEVAALQALQSQVDEVLDRGERVSRALRLWRPESLGDVRAKLMAARPRRGRCVYCEDSTGSELDHVRPRTTCPELAYELTNLVCACGPCNNPGCKGSRDAVLDAGAPSGWREITPRRGSRSPPPIEPGAWLNPHAADPLALMRLDILGETFLLENVAPSGPERAMVDWTLTTLGLNTRDSLVRARRVAYRHSVRWLRDVATARAANDQARLARLRDELGEMDHPTVWEEMKRQRADVAELGPLFAAAPETLTW